VFYGKKKNKNKNMIPLLQHRCLSQIHPNI
jgi:hypothetical protein